MKKEILPAAMLEPEAYARTKRRLVTSTTSLQGVETPNVVEEGPEKVSPKPMRKYEYAEPKKERFGIFRKQDWLVSWLLPVATFVGIVAFGLFMALHLWMEGVALTKGSFAKFVDNSGGSTATTEARPHLVSARSEILTDSGALRRAYLESAGGVESLRMVDSMSARGKLFSDGRSVDFQVVKKSPEMGAVSVDISGSAQRYVMNGGVAWEVLRIGADRSARSLNEAEKYIVALASQIFDPMTQAALGMGGRIDTVSEVARDGTDCLLVEIVQADGVIVECILEKASLRLLLEQTNVVRDGRLLTKQIRYEDYRETDGVFRPRRVGLYYDGELRSELVLDSVQVNPGVVSSLFSVPEELKI